MPRLLFIVLFCAGLATAEGQAVELELKSQGSVPLPSYRRNHAGEQEALREARQKLSALQREGYAEASIDSVQRQGKSLIVWIHTGSPYRWGYLRKGNSEEEVLAYTGFREKVYFNRRFHPDDIATLSERILQYYENHGYPFASVKLDSVHIADQTFSASLHIDKNQRYQIDSILVKGDATLSEVYLYNYLSLKPGDIYNESLIRRVDTRLKEIPFVEVLRPAEIVFTEKQANLYLFLRKKKASQFDGILGVLPDNQTGKITLTGDVRIRLKNAFAKGEAMDFNWRKLSNNIQDLKINFNYPFLFRTPIGTDLSLKLYKKDSTFLELHKYAALQYMLKGGDFFKVFINHHTSDLLTPSMYATATTLPSFADVSTLLYGIGMRREKLDYRLNPRKGLVLALEGAAGNKQIKKNPKLDQQIYERVTLKSIQYQVSGQGELFIPVLRRSAVKIGVQGAWMQSENLFTNELFRIGGIRTLRGFDEESILASFYGISTVEYRFLLEQNSAVYLFFDGSYYERRLQGEFVHDTPFGFGAGISFETKAGIFSLNYALGKQFDNPILFRAAKIHFGFVNYF